MQWIFQAEQFFDYYGVPDNHRLKIASVHFDGPVIPWFQRLQKSGKLTSWQVLTASLERKYGPSVFDCPRHALLRLTQEGSVTQFHDHLTALVNRVSGVSEEILLDCFLSGLKRELQAELVPWNPDDLEKAVTLAKVFEEKLQLGTKTVTGKNIFAPDIKFKAPPRVPTDVASTQGGRSSVGDASSNSSSPFRKMGFQEMQVRKAKGLCFTCDEKYSPTHNCPNKRLLLLQWDDTETDNSDSAFLVDLNPPEEENTSDTKLSLNAMSNLNVSGTMRFTGEVGGQKITILLDGG